MNIRFLSVFLISVLSILAFASCDKDPETITKTDTLYVNTTIQVRSIDTVFKMNANSWNAYSFLTNTVVDSGVSRYFTTAEGVKGLGQGYRLGIRLQTLSEVGFEKKNVYWKWKASGNAQFAGMAPELKYDPTDGDGPTPNTEMGIDFDLFSVNGPFTGYTQVTENTWYYTRMSYVPNSNNYIITTSTNNYSNLGGTVISTKTVPVYTKSGYISIRIGDAYAGSNAFIVLGECKISGN